MILSQRTIDVLNVFKYVNKSVLLKKGEPLRTKSLNNSVYMEALFSIDIDNSYGVYNLDEFLKLCSPDCAISTDGKDIAVYSNGDVAVAENKDSAHIVAPSRSIELPPRSGDETRICFALSEKIIKGIKAHFSKKPVLYRKHAKLLFRCKSGVMCVELVSEYHASDVLHHFFTDEPDFETYIQADLFMMLQPKKSAITISSLGVFIAETADVKTVIALPL